jgi:peroxiredoxin
MEISRGRKYLDKGMVVVGVSLDEEVKPVQEMVAANGMWWPQIHDTDQSLLELFNVKGTPTYYLIDRQGKIEVKTSPSKNWAARVTIS